LVYDVIIVGAGPAGAILAYELAKRSKQVLVLEKARLPRYKPCGGGLTQKTIRRLPFDVTPVLEGEAVGGIVSYRGRQLLRTQLPRPFAWLVMRDRFDHFLIQHAVEAGVQLVEGFTVTRVEQRHRQVMAYGLPTKADREESLSGVTEKHSPQCFTAKLLAGADGVNSVVSRSFGLLSQRRTGIGIEVELSVSTSALAVQGPYATFDFGALPHGYGWIFPKKEHLSAGVFRATSGKSVGLKRHLRTFVESQPVLRDSRFLKLQGHPIPLGGGRDALHRDRVLLVGDAANLADPYLGEGVYYAVVSAQMAAEVMDKVLDNPADDLGSYTVRVHEEIIKEFEYAGRFAAAIYRFPLVGSKLLARSPLMRKAVFGAIRGDLSFRKMNSILAWNMPRILLQSFWVQGASSSRVRSPP
jgi:geranylgeranyl reductase family protein